MPTNQIFVYDNGEKRELVGDELVAFVKQREADARELAKFEENLAEKKAQKNSLLAKLGITEDEAKLLFS